MMNKVAQYYRELVSSRSANGSAMERRDIDALVTQAREKSSAPAI